MKALFMIALTLAAVTPQAFAATYCGRVYCSDAADGCQIKDGKVNPYVMDRGGAPTKMSAGVAKAVEGLSLQCGCVSGSIREDSGPAGAFNRFVTADAAYGVAESRCADEDL